MSLSRAVLAVCLAQNSKAQVDGDVDQTAAGVGVLVAVRLAEDSQADVDGHVDQGTTVAARR